MGVQQRPCRANRERCGLEISHRLLHLAAGGRGGVWQGINGLDWEHPLPLPSGQRGGFSRGAVTDNRDRHREEDSINPQWGWIFLVFIFEGWTQTLSSLFCPLSYFLIISKPACDSKGCPQQINLNSAGLLVNEVRVPHHYKTFLCHNNYKTSRLLLIFVMVHMEACHLICERYQQGMWCGVIPDHCAPPTCVYSKLWPLLECAAQLKCFCQLYSGPVDGHTWTCSHLMEFLKQILFIFSFCFPLWT